jgi:hypothetical protein
MNTPNQASDAQIDELIDTLKDIATPFNLKPVNAETVLSNMPYGVSVAPQLVDHPLAAWLFQHFKPGSDILTKPKAYEIANELNRLQAELAEARKVRP